MDNRDGCRALEHFRAAATDMDQRKRLFNFDIDQEDVGCDIDLERWRYDEVIDWYVDEPWIGPEEETRWEIAAGRYLQRMRTAVSLYW